MANIWILVAIMAFGTVLSQAGVAKYSLALGGGCIRPSVYSQVVLGVTCFTGTALGTYFFEWHLVHVALFIVSCHCLRNIFYLVYAYSKQFAYSIPKYLWIVFAKPLLVFFIVVFLGYVLKLTVTPSSFVILCAEVLVVLLVYGVAAWLFLVHTKIKSSVLTKL
jgi:hypothetical protein